MAAPTVGKRSKTVRGKGKDNTTVKNVLFSPYTPEWPAVAVGETPKIQEEIRRTFEPYKILPGMKKMKEKSTTWSEKKWTPDSLQRVEEAKKLKAELRTHIVFGVNATTKCLEKGELQLVIACRSAKPPLLTSHLITLAACRGVPALALAGLSETLSKMMRARAIVAVGFKKSRDNKPTEFDKLAKFIMERTPPIELPWLRYKDIPLEELRQKVMEASNQRKLGGRGRSQQNRSDAQTPSKTPPGPTSKDSVTPSRTHDREFGQSVTVEAKGSDVKKDSKKESNQKPEGGQSLGDKRLGGGSGDDSRSSGNSPGDEGSPPSPVKRAKGDDTGMDFERQKKVAKVTHIPVNVVPIRSAPKEVKQERKKKKKNRKKKKR